MPRAGGALSHTARSIGQLVSRAQIMTGLNLSPLFPVCVAENYPLPENNGNHGHDDPAFGDSPEMEPFRGPRGKFFVCGWPEPFNPVRAIHRPAKFTQTTWNHPITSKTTRFASLLDCVTV